MGKVLDLQHFRRTGKVVEKETASEQIREDPALEYQAKARSYFGARSLSFLKDTDVGEPTPDWVALVKKFFQALENPRKFPGNPEAILRQVDLRLYYGLVRLDELDLPPEQWRIFCEEWGVYSLYIMHAVPEIFFEEHQTDKIRREALQKLEETEYESDLEDYELEIRLEPLIRKNDGMPIMKVQTFLIDLVTGEAECLGTNEENMLFQNRSEEGNPISHVSKKAMDIGRVRAKAKIRAEKRLKLVQ